MCSFFKNIIIGIVVGFGSFGLGQASFRVCLTQIVSHPSLDRIRQGILDELANQKLEVTVSFYNAEGQMATALQIAQTCVGQKPDAIVALATPSAQALAKAIKGKSIPFVFGAITDPVGAGLVVDLETPQTLVTGTIDVTDPKAQLAFFQSIRPGIQSLCALFNPAEKNAVLQVEAFAEVAALRGLAVIKQPVTKLSDIAAAMAPFAGKVQAFFIANDNLLVSGIERIVKSAQQLGIPLYASDPDSMQRGADAAFANDQYVVGLETGKLVARLLKGERSIPLQKIEALVALKKEEKTP